MFTWSSPGLAVVNRSERCAGGTQHPLPLSGSTFFTAAGGVRRTLRDNAEMQLILRDLEANLMHERRAQQELVYRMSVHVLDAAQWCTLAASLHPLHCNLESLLGLIASVPI